HHVRKNQPFSISPLEEIRGSTVLSAVPDIVIKMEKLRDFFQFTVVKNRISNNFQSLLLELEEGGFRFLQNVEGGVDENMSACIRYVEEFAKTATGNVFSPKEIAESSHYSRNLIYKAISLLQATGKIRKIKRGFYKYVLQTTLSNPGDEEEYE
ncbi:MAG: type IV toxin-antitoxin system AbiEi family antitoxin domain-containing protein, partial [Nitrososphaerota archaeon]